MSEKAKEYIKRLGTGASLKSSSVSVSSIPVPRGTVTHFSPCCFSLPSTSLVSDMDSQSPSDVGHQSGITDQAASDNVMLSGSDPSLRPSSDRFSSFTVSADASHAMPGQLSLSTARSNTSVTQHASDPFPRTSGKASDYRSTAHAANTIPKDNSGTGGSFAPPFTQGPGSYAHTPYPPAWQYGPWPSYGNPYGDPSNFGNCQPRPPWAWPGMGFNPTQMTGPHPHAANFYTPSSTPPLPSHPPIPPPPPPRDDESFLSHQDPNFSECDSHSLHSDSGDEEETVPGFSLASAIRRLAIISPEAVTSAQPSTAHLSAAERKMGCSAKTEAGSLLCESPMVVEALQAAMVKVRGQDEPPVAGSMPNLPSALPCGTFLTAKGHRMSNKKLLSSNALPSGKLKSTREDSLLVRESEKSSYSLEVKEKSFSEFEELTSAGLQSVSVMDSFLGGLVSVVSDDSSDSFSVKPDFDSADFTSFVQALSAGLKSTAAILASLHLNMVLCRRDALLQKSSSVKNARCRAALRAVPLHQSALFGNDHVSSMIHSLAESKRDLVFASPRPPSRSRSPSRQPRGRQDARQSHGPQRSHSFPSSERGGKTKSGGAKKPYVRKQAPKSTSKPSPQ